MKMFFKVFLAVLAVLTAIGLMLLACLLITGFLGSIFGPIGYVFGVMITVAACSAIAVTIIEYFDN